MTVSHAALSRMLGVMMERRAEFERETFQELAAVAAACSGMYAAYSAWLNHPASSGLAALIAILLLVVRLGVRPDSGSIHVRVHIALGAALIGIVVAAVTEDAMASLFLACLPLMAAMVAGSRAGIAWGLLCGVVLLSFGLSGLFDFQGRPLWFDALILTGMATLCGLAARKCHDHQSEEINRHCEIAEQHAKTIELGLAEAESARKEAEQAARAKADFLATMSHEIRNPLNGVVAISDMLIATPLNDTQKEYVTVARIACDSLLAIVNDVLDFSKMEAGKLVLQKRIFDPRETCEQARHLHAGPAARKDLVFTVDIAESIPSFVIGDSGRLLQIITNLISNSIKYTDHGSIRFRCYPIGSEARNPDGNPYRVLRFEVIDTGAGIDDATMKDLFKPFTQAGNRMSVEGSTGLGLTISKHIAISMGGMIEVASRVDIGSTFRVDIPFDLPTAMSLAQDEQQDIRPHVSLKGRHILVVEDNPINQVVARALLEQMECRVDCVSDGSQALGALQTTRYDAVLMDCRMPIMDGYEACKAIRTMGKAEMTRLPVLAMTASIIPDEQRKCLDAGMNDIIHKPVRIKNLSEKLRRWIE